MTERPRDRYGRPLPHDADPALIVPGVPDRAEVSSEQAWREAMAYLDEDLPFHAHEVFEQRWKCAPAAERECWQALAQWGAALTHQKRGNHIGMRRIAQRTQHRLERADTIPDVVDVALVLASCEALQR